jgi:hypothetical protein
MITANLKNGCLAVLSLVFMQAPSVGFSQNPPINCPVLTANDIKKVIEKDTIATEQGYTLATEADMSPVEVLQNEPTSNPFDTFYSMIGNKTFGDQEFVIYIGNILGKDNHEAKHRAKKILLTSETRYTGHYFNNSSVCIYKMINASPSISGYPFKSEYETVFLAAVLQEDEDELKHSTLFQKHKNKR